jgi:hypothetical protein
MDRSACCLIFVALFAGSPAFAADTSTLAPELKALDAQAGKWVYHGTTAATPKDKAGTFTWNEDCSWSANQLFLMCSFDNDWSGQKVRSLVVDTYNDHDKTYWHYEMFASGSSGDKPFISKMTVAGDTWTEYGEDDDGGKKSYDRIVYQYVSATQVKVKIEISSDKVHWTTVVEGVGEKQP